MDFRFSYEMRRFFAPIQNFSESNVTLDLEETRHLRDVLRLKIADEVRVFNGEGKEFRCKIVEISKKSSTLSILEEVSPISPESNLELILAVALLKGDKLDLVVQKAVELGVAKFVPISTIRSDAKSVRLDRLQRIALEATKQCGRTKLMQISELIDFNKFVPSAEGERILFAERNGGKLANLKSGEKITAFIGPEGGWEESEIDFVRENNFQIVTLGGRILRAETAAISITSLLQHSFGDLN
jgi:16S rRNA (uracil1498-N3)-methyltransferase